MKWPYLGILLITGCGWFTTQAAAPIIASAIDSAAKLIQEHTGKSLDEFPTHCEQENHPGDQKLLILCTVCYGLEDGETCQ